MKKIIGILAATALLFAVSSCANDDGVTTIDDAVTTAQDTSKAGGSSSSSSGSSSGSGTSSSGSGTSSSGSGTSSSGSGTSSSGSGTSSSGSGSESSSTYTLDITKVPTTQGTTNKLDDTVTVVSTATNSKNEAQVIKYSSSGYVQMSGTKCATNYALQLTLTKAATITVTATKKSSTGTATAVVLLDSTGAQVFKTSGIDNFGATPLTSYTLTASAAGTYYLGADANGCFLYSMVIKY